MKKNSHLLGPSGVQALQKRIQSLESQLDFFEHLVDNQRIGILMLDKNGLIQYINPHGLSLLACTPEKILRKPFVELLAQTDNKKHLLKEKILRSCSIEQSFKTEHAWLKVDNTQKPFQIICSSIRGGVYDHRSGTILLLQDISERKVYEKNLLHLVKYDVLTGLANRSMFFDFYQSAKARALRSGKAIGFLLVEVEDYRVLHGGLGFSIMDQILVELAQRIQKAVRDSDLVGRMDTDRFAVLVPDLNNPTDASRVAKKVLETTEQTITISLNPVQLRLNIGIAIFPYDENERDIEGCAELALMESKKQGVNRYHYYEPHMQAFVSERLEIEKGLNEALQNEWFTLHYQPKYESMTNHIEGVEALIRWESDERPQMTPDKFIPIAEEIGLIHDIGLWVLEKALSDASAWLKAGWFENKVMSINVSPIQLKKVGFVTLIEAALKKYEFPPQQFEIEITESCLLENPEIAILALEQIQALGVKIAIDDFGTGFSSLNYLRHLPIDTLKVDRSFVNEIGKKSGSEEIIKVILSLARIFNLHTIAEGVEDNEAIIFLRALQCSALQGFFFSKPLPKKAIEKLLQADDVPTKRKKNPPSEAEG